MVAVLNTLRVGNFAVDEIGQFFDIISRSNILVSNAITSFFFWECGETLKRMSVTLC